MMRILYLIFAGSLLAACILFAVENTQEIDVGLFPLPGRQAMPMWFLWLCTLFSGLVLGFVVTWVTGSRMRVRAREANRRARWKETEIRQLEARAAKAEAEVATLKRAPTEQPDDAPPGLAPPAGKRGGPDRGKAVLIRRRGAG